MKTIVSLALLCATWWMTGCAAMQMPIDPPQSAWCPIDCDGIWDGNSEGCEVEDIATHIPARAPQKDSQ